MNVASLTLFRYALPLVQPLPWAGGNGVTRNGCLVRWEAEDGSLGWGDCAPLPGFGSQSLEACTDQLKRLRDEAGATGRARPLERDDPSVHWALRTAARHAAGQGGGNRDGVNVNALVVGQPDAWPEAAAHKVARGFTCLKLKVGRNDSRREAEGVRAVRERVGPAVRLRLDANRAWDLATALSFADAVTACTPEYIEEPLADARDLPRFMQRAGLGVALDETLRDVPPATWSTWHGVAAVVLKPSLLPRGCLEAALAFARARPPCRVVYSSALESSVGLLGLAREAREEGGAEWHGLDTAGLFAGDVLTRPVDTTHGLLDIAAHDGAPIVLAKDRIREIT